MDIVNVDKVKEIKKRRDYYEKKYSHLNLYFGHGPGWDKLTIIAAMELDMYWPRWMPNWFKRFNNYLLYAHKGRSLIRTTKFYHSPLRKLFPFIREYPRFLQIKEKFGGLRLYGAGELESALESLSYHMCEDCGSTYEIGYTEGWIRTLCKKCSEKNPNIQWHPREN